MSAPRQLTLTLGQRAALSREDFLVSASNRAAFEAVAGAAGPARRLALSGPAGAGKSHLAAVWAATTGAVLVPASSLDEALVARLAELPALAIEDADRAGAGGRAAEARLFHALNITQAEGIPLLLTGRAPPARWPVATADLASRLAAMHHVAIQPPDDALLMRVLAKLFADRQLDVAPEVLDFLVRRIERTFAAAERAVERLDRAALAERRAITTRLARELYGRDDATETGDGDG